MSTLVHLYLTKFDELLDRYVKHFSLVNKDLSFDTYIMLLEMNLSRL